MAHESRNTPCKMSADQPLWLWSKTSSIKWEDVWEERLRFLPPGTLAMLSSPGSRALRLRAYVDAGTGRRLVKAFGGSLRRLEKAEWNHELAREIRPLAVRNRLVVFSEKRDWEAHRQKSGARPCLWIPASMAFGTGSHPTTAGCLRQLCDAAAELPPGSWHHGDLGAGSGILALAALRFGAASTEAIDYDPVCLREMLRNARANRLSYSRAEVADVHRWRPQQPCAIITANIFSDTLISAAKVLATGLRPGGVLIFSGVLRAQLPEVLAALAEVGLTDCSPSSRGKWVVGTARRPQE